MKFSVITINYNHKDGLRSTIESVVRLRHIDYEFIVTVLYLCDDLR